MHSEPLQGCEEIGSSYNMDFIWVLVSSIWLDCDSALDADAPNPWTQRKCILESASHNEIKFVLYNTSPTLTVGA